MSDVLYRRYRPKTFDEVVGQNHIKVTLANEIERGKISHAYLFAGPRGVGKTTIARLFAKAVNCKNRKGHEPCNKCDFCTELAAGRFIDFIEMDAASHTGVDNVRENIIENARFTPTRAPYKVFVIDEVHMLSTSAFNALLKTLEEPPQHVIFILATTEIHKVPATIISRCQRFDFKKVTIQDLKKRLSYLAQMESVKVEDSVLDRISRRADGSVRDAEVFLSQLFAIGGKEITEEEADIVLPRSDIALVIEFVGYLIHRDLTNAIGFVNRAADEGVNLQELTKDVIEFLRRLLLYSVTSSLDQFSSLDVDEEERKKILEFGKLVSSRDVVRMIELFMNKVRDFRSSPLPQLPLELAAIELCEGGQSMAAVEPPKPRQERMVESKAIPTVQPAQKKGAKAHFTLADVQKTWASVLTSVNGSNHALAMILQAGVPLAVSDGKLTIGFRFKLHEEQAKGNKTLLLLEKMFTDLIGSPVRIKTKVVPEAEFTKFQLSKEQESGIFQDILSTFGGSVVSDS